MFPWFKPCDEHDWVSYGLVRQCRKCLLLSPILKKMCPTCEGGGSVFTYKDMLVANTGPLAWFTNPPKPKKCPTCKGMGLVDVE